MPLHEVGAAHERPMLRCAAVVVPEIEIGEVDSMREGWPRETAILAQVIHYRLGSGDLGVGALHNFFALSVDAVNQNLRVALSTDLLHIDLGLEVVRSMSCDCVRKVPTEPVRWVVRDLESIDAAQVARSAGWHKHVPRRQLSRIRIEVQQISLRREHDPMF